MDEDCPEMAHMCVHTVHTLFRVPTLSEGLPNYVCWGVLLILLRTVLPLAAFFVSLAFSTEWLKAHLFPMHKNVLELKDLIV